MSRLFSCLALSAVALAVLVPPAEGQLFRKSTRQVLQQCLPGQPCYQGTIVVQDPFYCPAPVYQLAPVEPFPVPTETIASAWYTTLVGPRGRSLTVPEETIIRSWARRAVRIINGNSCGTGNLCGRDSERIYILTNAHVASSRIGNVVVCEALKADGSGTEKFQARVIEAAYSSRTSTDWALLAADAAFMASIEPIKLSKTDPDADALTGTWGCPRCEVPSGQLVVTKSLGSIWYWQPNSIGGQSGSAVVQDGTQKGLLTWTISGDGAGQKTGTIYRQSVEQNTDGPARVDGMMLPKTAGDDVELIEGYHAEATSLGTYPIWAGDPPPRPDDPNDPICDDPDVKRFLDLRNLLKQRGYNWIAIFNLIMQLIEEFSKG